MVHQLIGPTLTLSYSITDKMYETYFFLLLEIKIKKMKMFGFKIHFPRGMTKEKIRPEQGHLACAETWRS